MKTLKIAYCSTPDGIGKDIVVNIPIDNLEVFSKLPFGTVKAYSIHKQDNNLVQCVCDALAIEQVQLLYIEFV